MKEHTRFLRRGTRSLAAATVAAAMAWGSGAAAQQLYFPGDGQSRGITGEAGSDSHIVGFLGSGDNALYGLSYGERADHPCYFRAHGESLNDVATDFEDEEDRCGSRGPRDRSRLFVGWIDGLTFEVGNEASDADEAYEESADRYFIHGVQGCFERHKLKGLNVMSIRVLEDGSLGDPPVPPLYSPPPGVIYGQFGLRSTAGSFVRSQICNGNDWANTVECGPRQVAVAIGVHYERGKQPENITGLELWCRRVAVRPSKQDIVGGTQPRDKLPSR